MSFPVEWRDARDPAELFLLLWTYVNAAPRSDTSAASEMPCSLGASLAGTLEQDDGSEAVQSLCDLLEQAWVGGALFGSLRIQLCRALSVMRAIDVAILAIHPRSQLGARRTSDHPAWLQDVSERRTMSGTYARDERYCLVARGPFMRSARAPLEEATFLLSSQFASLDVAEPGLFREDGRPLAIRFKVIDHSADMGVPHSRESAANEAITFVPLAEKGDLDAAVFDQDGSTYIDIVPCAHFDPASRFLAAVADCPGSDILIAPELTVKPGDVRTIAAGLAAMPGKRARLLVAGSGASECTEAGALPYNQTSVLNGNGALLWEHRKVAPYDMRENTYANLKIEGLTPGTSGLKENIQWSDEITIADVDGLGRCLVLICQDLQMEAVRALIAKFRPDWVLIPIMDSGTSLVRWPARKVRELASASEARFAVVSSLTMKAWLETPYPGEEMGVAIGPKAINRADTDLDVAGREAELSPESEQRRHATLRWRAFSGWREEAKANTGSTQTS